MHFVSRCNLLPTRNSSKAILLQVYREGKSTKNSLVRTVTNEPVKTCLFSLSLSVSYSSKLSFSYRTKNCADKAHMFPIRILDSATKFFWMLNVDNIKRTLVEVSKQKIMSLFFLVPFSICFQLVMKTSLKLCEKKINSLLFRV